MPYDKDFGYVILTWGLTWEYYGDLWQLTYVTMSETTPKDHLIILRELLAGNKTLARSSSTSSSKWLESASKLLSRECKVTSELYCIYIILYTCL